MEAHPSHRDQLQRLNRARGQIDGVVKMITEGRYCVDILTQLRAARSALRAVEDGVLRTHVQHCIQDELARGQTDKPNERLDELIDVLTRYSR
ncbi:MAG: metal-sensing transcriptional repressor [Gammaproteobacteria bacterium]|jgi:DNA-binding FrmR family transcriptional regulator|nr:metal-sensing transcriptional repressor [Gammaproteobacteria bacterium]